jgi:hypothetical protein
VESTGSGGSHACNVYEIQGKILKTFHLRWINGKKFFTLLYKKASQEYGVNADWQQTYFIKLSKFNLKRPDFSYQTYSIYGDKRTKITKKIMLMKRMTEDSGAR